MLATSPAVRISGTGSCGAVPVEPEIGQGPAPRCSVQGGDKASGTDGNTGHKSAPGLQEEVEATTRGRGIGQSSQLSRKPQMSFICPDKYSSGYQVDAATTKWCKTATPSVWAPWLSQTQALNFTP